MKKNNNLSLRLQKLHTTLSSLCSSCCANLNASISKALVVLAACSKSALAAVGSTNSSFLTGRPKRLAMVYFSNSNRRTPKTGRSIRPDRGFPFGKRREAPKKFVSLKNRILILPFAKLHLPVMASNLLSSLSRIESSLLSFSSKAYL